MVLVDNESGLSFQNKIAMVECQMWLENGNQDFRETEIKVFKSDCENWFYNSMIFF
jgi:hypothetical protein